MKTPSKSEKRILLGGVAFLSAFVLADAMANVPAAAPPWSCHQASSGAQ